MLAAVTGDDFRIGHQLGQDFGILFGFAGNQALPDGDGPAIGLVTGFEPHGEPVEEFQFHTLVGLDFTDRVDTDSGQAVSAPHVAPGEITPGGGKFRTLPIHIPDGEHFSGVGRQGSGQSQGVLGLNPVGFQRFDPKVFHLDIQGHQKNQFTYRHHGQAWFGQGPCPLEDWIDGAMGIGFPSQITGVEFPFMDHLTACCRRFHRRQGKGSRNEAGHDQDKRSKI